jgi:hypothetical protein
MSKKNDSFEQSKAGTQVMRLQVRNTEKGKRSNLDCEIPQ